MEQSTITGHDDQIVRGDPLRGRAVHGVISAQREIGCETCSSAHQAAVDMDHIEVVEQVVEQPQAAMWASSSSRSSRRAWASAAAAST